VGGQIDGDDTQNVAEKMIVAIFGRPLMILPIVLVVLPFPKAIAK
jgi:hypothetical protein